MQSGVVYVYSQPLRVGVPITEDTSAPQ